MCWYYSRDDFRNQRLKRCILKYSKPVDSIFGWAPVHYDTAKDILHNGKLCQTGVAVPIGANNTSGLRPQALCVNVTSVNTDQGFYQNFQTEVPQCLVANKGSQCIYNYSYRG
jgi:hypothetical protein